MGFQISQVKELADQGKVIPLEKGRGKAKLQSKIVSLLSNEVLSINEIKDRLGISESSAYNAVRRYEKKDIVVAFDINGTTHYVEKKKAEEGGLI